MGSKHVFLSLTVQGWLQQSISVFDQMLGEFFLSEYSQTFLFTGSVSSFPWILQRYKGDMQMICNRTKETLITYLSTQFPSVDINVDYKAVENSINRYNLILYAEVTGTDGEKVNLVRLVNFDDTKVFEVMKTLVEG